MDDRQIELRSANRRFLAIVYGERNLAGKVFNDKTFILSEDDREIVYQVALHTAVNVSRHGFSNREVYDYFKMSYGENFKLEFSNYARMIRSNDLGYPLVTLMRMLRGTDLPNGKPCDIVKGFLMGGAHILFTGSLSIKLKAFELAGIKISRRQLIKILKELK